MHVNTKIATCCYCGKKAALVLKGRSRHELACSGCGAPLHDMKMLKSPLAEAPEPKRAPSAPYLKHPRGKPRNRKRGGSRLLICKIFDELEDLFDDILD